MILCIQIRDLFVVVVLFSLLNSWIINWYFVFYLWQLFFFSLQSVHDAYVKRQCFVYVGDPSDIRYFSHSSNEYICLKAICKRKMCRLCINRITQANHETHSFRFDVPFIVCMCVLSFSSFQIISNDRIYLAMMW